MLQWKGTDNDLTANIDEFTLRVEQMGEQYFWWCVYYKDELISGDHLEEFVCTTIKQAKNSCIKSMNDLKKARRIIKP